MKKLKSIVKEEIENLDKVKMGDSIATEAINEFKIKIPAFYDVKLQWRDNGNDAVGEYQHNSAIDGTPLIYLYKDTIFNLPNDEFAYAIRMTIFHELAHALVNIDNYYVFKRNQNILQFQNEEEFVEDFAFEFELFSKVPKDVLKLSKLFKNKKWKSVDPDWE